MKKSVFLILLCSFFLFNIIFCGLFNSEVFSSDDTLISNTPSDFSLLPFPNNIIDPYFAPLPLFRIQEGGFLPNNSYNNWVSSPGWSIDSTGFDWGFDYSNRISSNNLWENDYNSGMDLNWGSGSYNRVGSFGTNLIPNSTFFPGTWYPNNQYRMMPQYPRNYPDPLSSTTVYWHDGEIVKITPLLRSTLSIDIVRMVSDPSYIFIGMEPYPSNNTAMW